MTKPHKAVCDTCWGKEAPVVPIHNGGISVCEKCLKDALGRFQSGPTSCQNDLEKTEQFYLMLGMRNAMIDMLKSLSSEGRGFMLRCDEFMYCLNRLDPCTEWPSRAEIYGLFEDGMKIMVHLYHEEHNLRLPPLAKYVAITTSGSRIISTLARTRVEAASELSRQLQKPGREDPLSSWANAGHLIHKELITKEDLE